MSREEDLRKQIEELIKKLENGYSRRNPTSEFRDNTQKWMTWGRTIIFFVILIVGLGVSSGIFKTRIEVLEDRVALVEDNVHKRIIQAEQDIHQLQLKQAAKDPVIEQIKRDVTEIKADVKKLTRGN